MEDFPGARLWRMIGTVELVGLYNRLSILAGSMVDCRSSPEQSEELESGLFREVVK